MENKTWVVVVYDQGEKVNSWVFDAEEEVHARLRAENWIHVNHGDKTDWSLHRVSSGLGI